jgi:DNA-binding PadR family transcriptional regulator
MSITKSAKFSSLLKLQILGALSKPSSGYDIIRSFKATGQSISPSQVYPFLAELRQQGMIQIATEGSREKKSFALTEQGLALVSQLTQRLDSLVRNAMKKKLVSCHHCKAEVYSSAYAAVVDGELRMFCCQHCAADCMKK